MPQFRLIQLMLLRGYGKAGQLGSSGMWLKIQ
jgi:hypothetical protein